MFRVYCGINICTDFWILRAYYLLLISNFIRISDWRTSKGGLFRPPAVEFYSFLTLNSEKVAVGFFVFVAVPSGVAAVDLNQPLKGTSGLLEKPCGFYCVTPSGGKGESLYSVLPHGFNQLRRFVVPDHFADIEVIVTAVP